MKEDLGTGRENSKVILGIERTCGPKMIRTEKQKEQPDEMSKQRIFGCWCLSKEANHDLCILSVTKKTYGFSSFGGRSGNSVTIRGLIRSDSDLVSCAGSFSSSFSSLLSLMELFLSSEASAYFAFFPPRFG